MARIRSIKPELPQSESMGKVSRDARLTFILLWTLADDEGRLRGNSRMLASLLFPYDDDARDLIDGWLGELDRNAVICRYQVDGESFIQICKWLDHQKIDKPSRSKIPPFHESMRSDAPQPSAPPGPPAGTPPARVKLQPRSQPAQLRPDGVEDAVWDGWMALRKAKRAPVTQTVIDTAVSEAAKAGLSLNDFLTIWCFRGSQGLQAEWLKSGDFAILRSGQSTQTLSSAGQQTINNAASLKARLQQQDDQHGGVE